MYRRDSRHDGDKCTSASGHEAVDAGGMVVRRLAEMCWIRDRRDDKQRRKHDEGNDGDGGNNAGFHDNQSFQNNNVPSLVPWDTYIIPQRRICDDYN